MRTRVVFPAPFGPRRPKTIPSRTSRSTPARAVVDPNLLTTPLTLIAGGALSSDPLVAGCNNELTAASLSRRLQQRRARPTLRILWLAEALRGLQTRPRAVAPVRHPGCTWAG